MFDAVAYINEPRWRTMSLGLDRIEELLARLASPQERLRFIHVAGTNGKGSTCAFVASVLKQAGYKTGLFTSPYLERFEERIRINGTPITPEDLRDVTLCVRDAAEAMADHPTEFELMTAVAFLYFAKAECDCVVAEVGLGGRLDSTNVIDTVEASLIAPVSYDHCALLGNTLAEIAGEKAGIIKEGIPVTSARQDPSAAEVLERKAQEKHAPLMFVNVDSIEGANADFSYTSRVSGKTYDHLRLSLAGSYQRENAALALEGCETLRQKGWRISDEALREGLARAFWPGRFELVHTQPDVIIDGAHNIHAARQLAYELDERYPLRRIIFCMGVMADKDYQSMLETYAPLAKAFICYAPKMDRSLAPGKLAACAMQALAGLDEDEYGLGCLVSAADSAADAVHQAFQYAGPHDVVCCCGSLYGIAEVKHAWEEELGR